ncbi:hypothetical protein [Corynebacterium sp. Marseille-P4611]|uniref:hypothetical protein n=1 Tax=Corynebacterium sp. Marseille-P4611 TaxID=2866575 RepID=UPI001CE4B44F|nr:hypothetical protein [Corynebacterium sp. Marseille-P4611]
MCTLWPISCWCTCWLGLSVAVDMCMVIVSALSMFVNKLAPFWNEGKALERERGH